MIILGIDVTDRSGIKGLGRKFGALQKQAIVAGAEDWHRIALLRHFTPGNASRYRMAKRTLLYSRVIKPQEGVGQGKYVDLTLKGKSKRFLQAFFTITGSKDRITLTMRPPGYFTRPFIGTYTDPETGKKKTITKQPDKPAEVTRTDAEDRDRIRRVVDRKLGQLIKAARQERRERITA